MRRTFTGLSSYAKVLAALNLLSAATLLGLRWQVITTCGGVINLWMCLGAFLLLSWLGFIVLWAGFLFSNKSLAVAMLAANASMVFLLFVYSVPDNWRFTVLQGQYENAVQFIETGQLATEDSHLSRANEGFLPSNFRYLSACEGRVLTRTNIGSSYVFFYNMVDWLSFSGYLYSSDNSLPDDGFFYTTSKKEAGEICKTIAPKWYFCEFID